MLLSSAPHHSAQRFSAPASGLRSLLVAAPDAARGGVVTRAAVAVAPRGGTARSCAAGGGGVDAARASGDGTTNGHCEDKATGDDMEAKDKETGSAEEEEELDGFWVSYGRRCPRRRLPPPIPSLVARGALRRTRTADGRLVIRIVPVVRPECIRARRRRDRLTMQLVEHEDDSPIMAPPLGELSSARQDDARVVAQADGDTATPAQAAAAREPETTVPAVPPPRVSSAGCFEDVFKFDPIGSSSLHQIPSLRMVH